MIHGFIKTAVASLPLRVADCDYNAAACETAIRRAADAGVRLLVLPELCITGYTCGDLFAQETLRAGALEALDRVKRATIGKKVLTFVGVPFHYNGKLYNTAAALYNGHILGLVPKTNLPNYGEFYEVRHFTPAPDRLFYVDVCGEKNVPFGRNLIFRDELLPAFSVGCEICEDLWSPVSPSTALALAGANIIVNPSASTAAAGKGNVRRALLTAHSTRLICAYAYANACAQESTTDLVFSGHCMIAERGRILAETESLEPDGVVSEIDVERIVTERTQHNTFVQMPGDYLMVPFSMEPEETKLTRHYPAFPFIPSDPEARTRRCREVLTLQAAGLKKRLEHSHAKTAVVGLSGGLDSTLALLVMVKAADSLGWPRERLTAVTMPCYGTTGRTRGNAEKMARELGVSFYEIPIGEAVAVHFKDIGLPEDDRSVTYENGQARERTQVLMDLANKLGGLVVGTGDLSELALGWATYNGDHMSMYAVNAGVPKTLIRHVVAQAAEDTDNATLAATLRDILDTPVSPELLPPSEGEIAQKTEDLVGPYELHDFFLYYTVRCAFRPAKIWRMALDVFDGKYDRETLLKWLKNFYRRFFAQQFKRSCLPDGPKIGSVALSPRGDWRMPSDAWATLWLKEAESLS